MSALDGMPPSEWTRLRVGEGDIVMVSPREASLTPNQAREVQNQIRAQVPDVYWLVWPFPVDFSVLTRGDLEEMLKESE